MLHQESNTIVLFILVISLFFCSLILIVLNLLLNNQKKKLVYEKDIEMIKSRHEQDILKSQIQTQENTFQNISREIHDNIGQKLTLAKLQINALSTVDSSLTSSLKDVVGMITESLDDLRDISRSLSSDMIRSYGLIGAVKNEINLISKTTLCKFILTVTGDTFFMTADKELIIFRIIQESLTNIIKHSLADEVNVALTYDPGQLLIVIRDNGKGFDSRVKREGNGLLNMNSRATSINGSFKLESYPGQGTTITCLFIQKNQPDA